LELLPLRFVQSPSASTPNTKSLACKLRPRVPPARKPRRLNGPVTTPGEVNEAVDIAAALQLLVPKA
jgi:hypothetical protein